MTAADHSREAIDWDRLPDCGVHGGRRCFPSESFARLIAGPSHDVSYCWLLTCWHITEARDEPGLLIPRQRTAA